MTVTRRQQQNYPTYASCNNSDTESLNLGSAPASDTESLQNEPVNTRPQHARPAIPLFDDLDTLKKCTGKKKLRRYQNKCILQTLAEEDEDDAPLIEAYKGPFARLLDDDKALEFWNDFIEKSQEEQSEIISYLLEKPGDSERPEKPANPFSRISSKIKRTIKVRKNVAEELLKTIEVELVEFFKRNPELIYKKKPNTSFERLLIHAAAQFHDLKSISVTMENKKQVQVENVHENWTPANCYLSQILSCGVS